MSEIIHFKDDEAEKYGVTAAILLFQIRGFVKWAKKNNRNNYEGRYWTYGSVAAWKSANPFLSEKQIVTAFKYLKEEGVIITGNFNKHKYDRTTWYSILNEGWEDDSHNDVLDKSIMPKGQMEETELTNGFAYREEPIPNYSSNYSSNKKEYTKVYSSPPLVKTSKGEAKKTIPFDDFLNQIPEEIKIRWIHLYCEDFLSRELIKMKTWTDANPKKSRKTNRGWVTFVANWLDRGWVTFQKTIASQPALSASEKRKRDNEEWIAEMLRKEQSGEI